MERLLNYCHKLMFLIALTMISSCQPGTDYYKKQFTKVEQEKAAELLLNGMGYRYYYQGSTGEQELVEEAAKHNVNHPEVWRERGIPYLKRGIAHGYMTPYSKCAELDPVQWQGYKGYCTLYFYRDYQSALNDFDILDPLTPDFVDYPQATSIEYMKALCYYGLDKHKIALKYIEQHINREIKDVGLNYIISVAFILKSKIHEALEQPNEAQMALEMGTRAHDKNADIEYYLAKYHYEKGDLTMAKKYAEKSKKSFETGYANGRPYVAEFFQVYIQDIDELLEAIRVTT